MMQGPIQRTQRHRVESRADARLPTAWIGGATVASTWTDGTWLTRKYGRATPADKCPVLLLLGNESADAHAAVLEFANTDARVYALVGPGWGKEQADNQLLQAPRLLIRRLAEVPATAIHAGAEASLWIGGGFILRLDPTQAEALRQTFLRLFWHEATEESWSGGRQFMWRPARERPFDVPEVPASATVRWEAADARLIGDSRGALMHVSAGLPPDNAPQRLWFPSGPDHHEQLAKFAQAGVEVLWANRGLPDFQVNGDAPDVLFPGTRGRLRVRLTSQQETDVARLLMAPPEWRFQTNVRLGEGSNLTAQFWLPGGKAARALEAEQLVTAPDVTAPSLRAVPDTAPTTVPAAQPLALAVRLEWTVVPPRLPAGADEDALVGRWRKLDEDWNQRLLAVRDALKNSYDERSRIGKTFSQLLSGVLGFERTHDALQEQLSVLEAKRLSKVGPAGSVKLLAQLEELEKSTKAHRCDLADAERKAHEDQERETQRAEWNRRIELAKKGATTTREDIAKEEILEGKLAVDASEIELQLTATTSDQKKDLLVRQKKIGDERKQVKDRLRKLRHNLRMHEEESNRQFEFKPARQETKVQQAQVQRFVPKGTPTRPLNNVPDDALPEVGSLQTHKGRRYLVINAWEHLDAGEKEAERLSANLVAPEDA